MNRVTVLVLALLLAFSTLMTAQNVNVTIRLNTATVPDTIGANSVVQVRGNTAPLTWGDDTGGIMSNVGGDYWEATLSFPANTTGIEYKFYVDADGAGTEGGLWESNMGTGTTNHEYSTGASDEVLDLQYFNISSGSPQFFRPFAADPDSINIWVRVNVARLLQDVGFDPATQVMGIRGGQPDLSWGDTKVLTPEVPSDNGGTYPAENFWSGLVKVDKDSIAGGATFEYKWVIGDAPDGNGNLVWEGTANRLVAVPSAQTDTTTYFSFWEDKKPLSVVGNDTTDVTFRADLTRALNENGFDPGSETVVVRYGFNASATIGTDTLVNEFGSNNYSVTAEVANVDPGSQLIYQYYKQNVNGEFREIFFDFFDTNVQTQERRKLDVPDPIAPVTIEDILVSESDLHRQPRFRNTSVLANPVTVAWEVDLRPAYYQVVLTDDTLRDIQGGTNINDSNVDSIFVWGSWMNGPAAGGWTGPGDLRWKTPLNQKMHDDGVTGGDLTAGDSVYTVSYFYSPDSSDVTRTGIQVRY